MPGRVTQYLMWWLAATVIAWGSFHLALQCWPEKFISSKWVSARIKMEAAENMAWRLNAMQIDQISSSILKDQYDGEVRDKMGELLESSDFSRQHVGLEFAIASPDPKFRQRILQLLDEKSYVFENLRPLALIALSRIREGDDRHLINEYMFSQDPIMRRAAEEAARIHGYWE